MTDTLEQRVQRLEDIHDLRNLMGMHEYLHAAGLNDVEFDTCFAKDAPGLTFEPEDWGQWIGGDAVRGSYVESAPPPLPGLLTEHAATTEVIEIAEDGLTAKGVWISPGHETFPAPNGGPGLALWAWGRYGIDFVKQDGEWKFWHFHIYTTFRTPFENSWVHSATHRPAELPAEGETVEGMTPPSGPISFNQPYHPDKPPVMQPVPPAPYRTFAETSSYTEPPVATRAD